MIARWIQKRKINRKYNSVNKKVFAVNKLHKVSNYGDYLKCILLDVFSYREHLFESYVLDDIIVIREPYYIKEIENPTFEQLAYAKDYNSLYVLGLSRMPDDFMDELAKSSWNGYVSGINPDNINLLDRLLAINPTGYLPEVIRLFDNNKWNHERLALIQKYTSKPMAYTIVTSLTAIKHFLLSMPTTYIVCKR